MAAPNNLEPPWNRVGVRRDRAAAQEGMRLVDLIEEARALSEEDEENEIIQQDASDNEQDEDEGNEDEDEGDEDDEGGDAHGDAGEINNGDSDHSDEHDEMNNDMDIGIDGPEDDANRSGDEGSGGDSGDGDSSEHLSSADEADNAADMNLNLLNSVRAWALHGVSANKVDEILAILHPHHPFLPKTYRTLVKTPPSGPIQELAGGRFWYKGIMPNLLTRVTLNYLQTYNEVVVDINMDGIPLHKSNSAHFFPILGCLQKEEEPFIIAIWHGFATKPNDLRAFLNDYVQEAQVLIHDGCHLFGNIYNFRIRNYICDAVARAYVKCCVGHNALSGCEKCDIRGVWIRRRTTFTSLEYNLRTDESFRNRDNPLHHHQMRSPLEDLDTGLVSQFRLDPLHLIFLGCFKRWLQFILTEQEDFRVTDDELEEICQSLLEINPVTPSDFARRPRLLKRSGNKLKGTELRRLLLYDGLKVFKHLDANLFQNYLLLQCAIYILSSQHLREYLDIANDIVQEFVSHSQRVFGRQFVVYNVHSLRHIVAECQDHGTLSDFDAFKYENYLGVMKRLLRSGFMSLQQVYNRDTERNGHLTRSVEPVNQNNAVLSGVHVRQGGELIVGVQYKKLEFRRTTLALNERDCYFMTPDSEIIKLSNIVHQHDENIALIGRKFARRENVYDFPIPSSHLGIWKVSELEDIRHIWNFAAFSRKCYLMPDDNSFISVPLLHFKQN